MLDDVCNYYDLRHNGSVYFATACEADNLAARIVIIKHFMRK